MSEIQAEVSALRARGAERVDPAGLRAIEALARRLDAQPAPVRAVLEQKLAAAIAACSARVDAAAPGVPTAPATGSEAGCAPLAELNAYLRSLLPAAPANGADSGRAGHELASVRRFRRTWDRVRTLDQLEQAEARKPSHAGPLNSHMLVLQSLALMRDLSTDYLRRFLVSVETLQWLEQAREKYPRPSAVKAKAAKTPRRARARK